MIAKAQDTIIKNNGDKIATKIIEVLPKEIKYKKFDFQDGPTYVEKKSELKMIIYPNGKKETFQNQDHYQPNNLIDPNNDYYSGPTVNSNTKIDRVGNRFHYQGHRISENELHDVLFKSKDKQIMSLAGIANDSKKLQYIGFGAIPLGIGSFYFLTRNFSSAFYRGPTSKDLALSAICFVGGIACPITSFYYKHRRNISNRQAINLYNEKF